MDYFNQYNYPNVPYPSSSSPKATIKSGGCGVCCAAMILSGLVGANVDIPAFAEYCIKSGARVNGGTNMQILAAKLKADYALQYKLSNSADDLVEHLRAGGMAIANIAGNRTGYTGVFSDSGHYVVVAAVDGDQLTVYDPAKYAGKYLKAGRAGKVVEQGNTCYCALDVIKADVVGRTPAYYLFGVKPQAPTKHWCQDTADLAVKQFGLDAGYWASDLDAPLTKAHFLAFMAKALPTDAELIPQEPQRFKAYDFDYLQTAGNIHHKVRVWEVAPELLRAQAVKTNLNKVQHDYLINSGYSWWTDAAHKQPYSLSILVSEGKVLANAVPHGQATGCLIVYEDNTVAVKQVADITAEQGVKFAVGGMTIAPKVLSAEEGFTGAYADVLRETARVVLGWHPVKQRVIIAGYSKMSAARGRDLLLELGCTAGITLDGGGSALMREAGRDVLTSDGRYQFGCVWVDI